MNMSIQDKTEIKKTPPQKPIKNSNLLTNTTENKIVLFSAK